MSELDQLIESTIGGLKYENPRLSSGLRKWKGFLKRSINRVSVLAAIEPETLFQDIMASVSEASIIDQVPMYRWKKRVWEIEAMDGDRALLVSPRMNRKKQPPEWVPIDQLEYINISKIESLIYTKIYQSCCDILTKSYNQKNGFQKVDPSAKWTRRAHSRKVQSLEMLGSVEKSVFVDCVEEVGSLEDSCGTYQCENPEAGLIFWSYVVSMDKKLRPTARKVLWYMITQNPGALPFEVSMDLGIKMKDAREAVAQIVEVLPFETQTLDLTKYDL